MAQAIRTGTSDVLVRTTAALFSVGGVAGTMLALDVIRTDRLRGLGLLVLALSAVATGPLLLSRGARLQTHGLAVAVVAGGAVIGIGTAISPTVETASAASALAMLVAIESMLFLRRRVATALVGVTGVLQLVPLLLVHHVSPFVCAAYAVLWAGVAWAAGVLARQASTAGVDALTGLADRRGWDASLEYALERRARRGTPLSLALIDIDHFKLVNDASGHAAGDDLLRATADAWRRLEVPGMVLGRRGGDEFAVLLPGSTGPEAHAVAEMLCGAAPAAASCGVAEHVEGESLAEVLRRTDTALYAAKAAGRGRTVLSQRRRSGLVDDLLRGIAAGELHVALQPVVLVDSRHIIGVEALARWNHPRLGPVPPLEFVAAAEDGGVMDQLGAAVLALACADARVLQDSWQENITIGINASGRELVGQGYADRVLSELDAVGWAPGQFVLEVTESVVEASGPAALRTLRTLREAGIRVAIDDFGTGYSSFSRLDELPTDFLKLDRQFLSTLTTSTRRTGMVRALISMCNELGVVVIAEGVETVEQAQFLEDLGCPLAQGYFYGRPMPVEALAAVPMRPADKWPQLAQGA